jgi:putative acetyltransferase
MILKRTDSDEIDFRNLVVMLDQDLKRRDGDDHAFFAQFNKIDKIRHVVVCYHDDIPVGCGAFKEFNSNTVEIKRMFVHPDYRGKGFAKAVLIELELWAAALNYAHTILETGKKQPEAIQLYLKSGYTIIPNYGQYENVENSICMTKEISGC